MSPRLLAFDFIAGCLSVRDDPDTDRILRSSMAAGSLDWDLIIAMADRQNIAPALWAALSKRALAALLPAKARGTLFKQHLLNTFKNKAFKDQAVALVRQFNAVGIEPVLLKGAVSLFLATFDDPGARVMADLDILVPAQSAQACWEALCAAGYQPIDDKFNVTVDYARHHHLRPLYRPNYYGTVEIHREALPESAARILPTALVWAEAEPVVNPFGVAMKAPSPSHRVLHNLLHSGLINGTYARGAPALRSLHELAAMQAVHGNAIDWKGLAQMLGRSGQGKVLSGSLYLAQRLLGNPLPEGIPGAARAVLHHARIRSQLRWSGLDELVERVCWFSKASICEFYRCGDDFWSVGKSRLRLGMQLIWKRAVGPPLSQRLNKAA